MKKTLYIHIGYHKTGTTSIQIFFWDNRSFFNKQGLLYPEIGLSGATHAQFALCLPGNRNEIIKKISTVNVTKAENPYAFYQGKLSLNLYKELGEEINKTKCTKILLSSECFLEWIEPKIIKEHLSKYCECDVKIIVYLRRQDLWIQSVFNQVVKDPYMRYANSIDDLPQISNLDYFETLSEWESQFGIDNIIVRSYEESLQQVNGTISDILNVLELEDDVNYHYPVKNVKNIGLTSWQIKILHSLNINLSKDELFQVVLKLFEKQNLELPIKHSLYLDYEKANELYNSYLDSNINLANKFRNGKLFFCPPKRIEYKNVEKIDFNDIAKLLIDRL